MSKFTLNRFIEVYADALNTEKMIAIVPRYENREYCAEIAQKMTNTVKADEYPSDWLKYNPAMKAAAKFFGIKTSKQFREIIKQSA